MSSAAAASLRIPARGQGFSLSSSAPSSCGERATAAAIRQGLFRGAPSACHTAQTGCEEGARRSD